MRAVVYRGLERVEVSDVPEPAIQDERDAIVRVTTTAICGSDLHFFHGKAPLDPGETIGHEAVGVVEAVGSGVERFAPGRRVIVAFNIACGHCWFCERGQTQLCEDFRNLGAGIFGGGLGGAQAELVRVPNADTNLLAIPEGMEDERVLFVGDVLTTGVYGAALAGIAEGESVAVVGAGPVGFFCVQAALALGAGEVLALDLEPDRLAQEPAQDRVNRTCARRFGACFEHLHVATAPQARDELAREPRLALVPVAVQLPEGLSSCRPLLEANDGLEVGHAGLDA